MGGAEEGQSGGEIGRARESDAGGRAAEGGRPGEGGAEATGRGEGARRDRGAGDGGGPCGGCAGHRGGIAGVARNRLAGRWCANDEKSSFARKRCLRIAKRIFYQEQTSTGREDPNAYTFSVPGKAGTCSGHLRFLPSISEDIARKIALSLGLTTQQRGGNPLRIGLRKPANPMRHNPRLLSNGWPDEGGGVPATPSRNQRRDRA